MNVTDLIVRAAGDAIQQDAQLLGVRICPVALTPEDVEPLRKALDRELDRKAFVALSVPGARRQESDRFFVSPDQAAAERATFWRNAVRVEDGQHLIYISVQNHGKAGGLQDCLTPIRESDLREIFAVWCDEQASGMPNGIGAALRKSTILERVSVQSLCEFATAVARDRRNDKWEAAGIRLPLLNLACDSGLGASRTAERLAENERIVSRAATGERAAGSNVSLAPLREAFKAEAADVREKLKQVDLKDHLAKSLGKKQAPKKAERALRATKEEKRNKPRARVTVDPTAALVDAAQAVDRNRLEVLEQEAKALGVVDDAPTQDRTGTVTDDSEGLDQVWTRAQQVAEFGTLAQRVPVGLGAMLLASLKGEGYGLVWEARESANDFFSDLPPQAEALEQRWNVADPVIQRTLAAMIEARRAAIRLLLPESDRTMRTLSTFINAPLVSLADRKVYKAMATLLEASAALYRAATESSDAEGRRTALALDTVAVRARSGDRALVVGPLHPLYLGQAMGRFDALVAQKALCPTARQLLVRSLSEAPAAPESWPSEGDPALQLSRPIGGLITYQSIAQDLEPEDVEETVARVIGLYLRSLPHAGFGLRVAVRGGEAAAVIEGAAAALEEAGEKLRRVEIHHGGPGHTAGSERVERAFASGRLAVGALQKSPGVFATSVGSHLVFHLAAASAPGVVLQPAAPTQPGLGASSGLLPTEFTVVQGGLQARTPIDGARFAALAAFEAVHALVGGGQPQCAFVRNAWAVSLRSLLPETRGPSVCWDVVLAPRIGRRPPEARILLSHERPTDALTVAIITRDVGPAARALKVAFQTLGVNNLRPLVLKNLAQHLASVTSQGVLSPFRSEEQVLAASVLGMALRRVGSGGEMFVAHCEGASAATLLGKNPSEIPGAFAVGFGAREGRLRVVLGYAALGAQLGVEFSRGQIKGDLGDSLARLSSTIELATTAKDVGAVAAREALNWLLWPALAAAEQPGSKTESLLLELDRGIECDLSAVAYLPPTTAALRRATAAKCGKLAVALRPLDVGTFEELVFCGAGAGG